MKKINLYVLILMILSLSSCTKDPENDIETETTEDENGLKIEYELIASSDTLIFHDNETQSLFITTKPNSKSRFQIISYPEWLDVTPESGQINRNLFEIEINSKLAAIKPGEYESEIEIFSTKGETKICVIGHSTENTSYNITPSIEIDLFVNSSKIFIENKGNIDIEYSLSFEDDVITAQKTSGTLKIGKQEEIVININRDFIVDNKHLSKINLTLNDKTEVIDVIINSFIETKVLLQSDVIDAEYSKTKDILVFASSNPLSLNIFDVATEEISSIDIEYFPTCVSISPDGNSAIIGHDARMTHIDLNAKAIINTYDVSCHVNDIVLSDNNWAYLFPKSYNWTEIISVDLSNKNDNEIKSYMSIHGNTKAKLHPSGKYIYGADNDLSPLDIEKYDIQNGAAEYLYDSPYHGDYNINGDLWLSEDGVRIFTSGKTVFKTNEIKENDMLYNGMINLTDNNSQFYSQEILWLDHSAIKNNLYIISFLNDFSNKTINPFIYVHNANNLTYKSKYEIENFLVENTFYASEPYFVFSTSNGESIYTIIRAKDSGLMNEWAIQKINIK